MSLLAGRSRDPKIEVKQHITDKVTAGVRCAVKLAKDVRKEADIAPALSRLEGQEPRINHTQKLLYTLPNVAMELEDQLTHLAIAAGDLAAHLGPLAARQLSALTALEQQDQQQRQRDEMQPAAGAPGDSKWEGSSAAQQAQQQRRREVTQPAAGKQQGSVQDGASAAQHEEQGQRHGEPQPGVRVQDDSDSEKASAAQQEQQQQQQHVETQQAAGGHQESTQESSSAAQPGIQ